MKGIIVFAACNEGLMNGVLVAGLVSIYKEVVYGSTADRGEVFIHKDPSEFHFGRNECCRIGITGRYNYSCDEK